MSWILKTLTLLGFVCFLAAQSVHALTLEIFNQNTVVTTFGKDGQIKNNMAQDKMGLKMVSPLGMEMEPSQPSPPLDPIRLAQVQYVVRKHKIEVIRRQDNTTEFKMYPSEDVCSGITEAPIYDVRNEEGWFQWTPSSCDGTLYKKPTTVYFGGYITFARQSGEDVKRFFSFASYADGESHPNELMMVGGSEFSTRTLDLRDGEFNINPNTRVGPGRRVYETFSATLQFTDVNQ